jgi:hypothetical protein
VVHPAKSLRNFRGFGKGSAVDIKPAVISEAGGFDDE